VSAAELQIVAGGRLLLGSRKPRVRAASPLDACLLLLPCHRLPLQLLLLPGQLPLLLVLVLCRCCCVAGATAAAPAAPRLVPLLPLLQLLPLLSPLKHNCSC
jgi:hypothetical protein